MIVIRLLRLIKTICFVAIVALATVYISRQEWRGKTIGEHVVEQVEDSPLQEIYEKVRKELSEKYMKTRDRVNNWIAEFGKS